MTKRYGGLTGFCAVTVLGLISTVQVGAQAKKPPKMLTYQGNVATVDKAKMMIGIKVGTVQRDVIYTADTKFLYGHSKKNKPGSADAVKEGNYILCGGTTEAGKPQLMATECVYREAK